MKKQKIKFNKSKLVARVMLVILLVASAVSLFGCYFGPTLAYHWEVNTHNEFVKEIDKFNHTSDGFVDTFISFDLDENEEVSDRIYCFDTIANATKVAKFGLCDKICSGHSVYLLFYLNAPTQSEEHKDHAYKIACYYRDVKYNFSENDKIEVKKGNTYKEYESERCSVFRDEFYQQGMMNYDLPENMVYNYSSHYEIWVNDEEFACIHISSIEEASEEKLDEIIQMLYDSLVIINTEG